jgi:hypothetical protein
VPSAAFPGGNDKMWMVDVGSLKPEIQPVVFLPTHVDPVDGLSYACSAVNVQAMFLDLVRQQWSAHQC